ARGAHPLLEPAQAGGVFTARYRCAAATVVEPGDVQLVGRLVKAHGDDGVGGLRVFGGVRQRLGDDEVGNRLRLLGQSARQVDVESRWDAEVFGALDDRRQRGVQAAISQD